MQTTNLKKKKQDHHNLMAIYKERPLNHVKAQKKKKIYVSSEILTAKKKTIF